MNSVKKSPHHIYDYTIVGAGLAGLCVSTALSRITDNVLLIEGGETFGGFNKSVNTQTGPINNGLRFFPEGDSSLKSLRFLEGLLGKPLMSQSLENAPVTFDHGNLKPFLGFGDHPPAFYEELAYFTSARSLRFQLEPFQWAQELFTLFKGDFLPRSFVTKFFGDHHKITHLTVNGQKTIRSHNVIYCGPVHSLAQLLPSDALSSRSKGKLSKSKYWTAVCLDFLHSQVVGESHLIHILNGTTQDDLGPCVGYFHPPQNLDAHPTQYSQWMTFVDDEESEDTEVTGAALKKIKRQIKRAYPQAFNELRHERILVVPDYSGNGDLHLSGDQSLPQYHNFWIGSSAMSPFKNLVGALSQAELVTTSLGCHPHGCAVQSEPSDLVL